jgi:hypothetical protein
MGDESSAGGVAFARRGLLRDAERFSNRWKKLEMEGPRAEDVVEVTGSGRADGVDASVTEHDSGSMVARSGSTTSTRLIISALSGERKRNEC